MAYPQAPIEMDMYMELPDGFLLKEGNQKDHVLKLLADLYGQKQSLSFMSTTASSSARQTSNCLA